MRDIGKNIRDLRQARNMTQDDLAERLFVTRQTVSNYETGRTKPDVDMLVRIAEVLEIDINALLYGPPQPPERKREIRKLVLAVCLVLILLPLYYWAGGLADWYRSTRYIAWPKLLLGIFVAPIPFLLLGWAVMQAIGTFTKLSPVENKFIRRIIGGFGIFYLVVMIPYVMQIITDLRLPIFWGRMVFALLGALPGIPFQLNPQLLWFLLGALMWLFPLPKKNKETA